MSTVVLAEHGPLRCDWCGAPAHILGPGEYEPLYAVKCTQCHHEWDIVLSKAEYRRLKKQGW